MNDIVVMDPVTSSQLTVGEKRPTINSAHLYLATLAKGQSQNRVIRLLNQIAQFFGWPDLSHCLWEKIRYPEIVLLKIGCKIPGRLPQPSTCKFLFSRVSLFSPGLKV